MPALPLPPSTAATRRDDAINEQKEQLFPPSTPSSPSLQISLPLDPASSIASTIISSHRHDNIVELRAPAATTTGFVAIPTTYNNLDDSLSPGVVVGIVLGSVGGVLVLLFLLYSALGFGPAVIPSRIEVADGSVYSVRTRDKHRRRRPSGVRATEMYEVRTRERVVPAAAGATPIVVEARRSTTIPRSASAAPPPPRVVRDSDDSDDSEDEVVVIEEHTPPRRKSSRRHSSRSRRSGERREERRRSSTTYTDGDPGRYRDGSRRYSRDR